jgi:outer membrane protein insertion porin family
VGAGYSATDKLVGTVGVGIPNFLGGGQTISFNVDYGSNRSTFDLEYYEPWLFDTPTSIDLNAYYQERDYSDWFTEGRRGGSVRVGRRLRWPDNYTRVYGSYRLEDLKYYNYSSTYLSENKDNPYSVDKVSWPQITSVLGLSFERDSRDLAQFATKGSVYSWSGDIAGTVLGGNWNYWKQIFQAQYYYTPYWKFTFSAKAKWGIMDGIRHGDNDVPYSERFTPGGTDPDGVIRGYSDSRVGPRTPSGGYLGGRGEVIYNLELTVPVSEQQFYALLFADAGNAYLTGDGLKRNLASNFYKSVGFGFRVVAPMIGIIGFDFGYAFNGEDKGKIRPHFQIGRGF